jgi:hypothetical protein
MTLQKQIQCSCYCKRAEDEEECQLHVETLDSFQSL